MSRKAILILCAVTLLAGYAYFKLFYKTYNHRVVAASADNVVALDVKRIRNTLLWEYVTTPSQWQSPSLSRKPKALSWKDMLHLPDYLCLFHVKGTNEGIWFTVLEVSDDQSFNEGLNLYGFAKLHTNEYYSDRYALSFIRSGKNILLTNGKGANNSLKRVAGDL